MMHLLRSIWLFGCVLVLGACASGASGPSDPTVGGLLWNTLSDRGFRITQPVQRIDDFQLARWSYVDPLHIQVEDGTSGRDFLLTFAAPCDGLATLGYIAVTNTRGGLEPYDRVMARLSGTVIQCEIRAIRRLARQPST